MVSQGSLLRSRNGRRRARWAGVTVSLALAAGVVTPVQTALGASSASASAEKHGGRPHPQKVWQPRDVKGLDSTPAGATAAQAAAKAQAQPSQTAQPPAWPGAEQFDADLTATSTAGPAGPKSRSLTSGSMQAASAVTVGAAGSLVGAASPAERRLGDVKASKPSSQSPSTAQVTVAPHAAAVAAGVSGVIVTVSQPATSTASGPADIAVSYSAWSEAFGGNFSDRLALVQLPACALTTPSVASCRVQTPVKFVNDHGHQQLAATVTLPKARKNADPQPSAATASATAASSGAMVLAATSTASGTDGTYAASSLKASDSWSMSGNSGSFEWSYPIATPPSLGGGSPDVSLSYDSGSVDGRTTVSNGQTSVMGEGFDLGGAASYIETSYKPCAKVDSTNWGSSGDMCQGTPNAAISGGSHAGALVRDDADNTKWRLSTDDGTRVQFLTGANGGNNTVNGSYWKLTGTDGTVYLYGANRLPVANGGDPSGKADNPTYSTWSVPVFGTGVNTPCNDPTSADPDTCRQGWRWNLDFVIDPHGNVSRYSYAREEDYYLHKTATPVTEYTGGGFLREIDYGWRTGDVATANGLLADHNTTGALPAATVLFNYVPRCVYSPSNTACPVSPVSVNAYGVATTGISDTTAGAFTDVPWDQHCNSGSTTCSVRSPAYFSTVRLTEIQTAVNNGAATASQPTWVPTNYRAVDWYQFGQSFPAPPDGSSGNRAQLWLDTIDHWGYVVNADGGVSSLNVPRVNLGHDSGLPNRDTALTPWTTAGFARYRLNQITDETGAVTTVAYGLPGTLSCGSTAPPATIDNHTLCYPEYYKDSNGTKQNDWFFKYVVTSVSVKDGTSVNTTYSYSKTHTSAYTYLGNPAWHTNDSEQVDSDYRTVDQYRGFGQVQTVSSGEPNGSNAKSVTTYFQGMDQDPSLAKCVNDSHAQAPANANCPTGFGYRDDNALAGQALETQVFASESSNTVVSDTISVPEDPTDDGMVTATHVRTRPLPDQRAHFSHIVKKIGYAPLSTGGERRTETDYAYDNSLPNFTGGGNYGGNGHLLTTDDKGDTDAAGNPLGNVQELCTFTGYADNPNLPDGVQWTSYPNESITYRVMSGGHCTTNSETADTVTAQSRTLYDEKDFPQVVAGSVTSTQALPSFNGTPVTTAVMGYDGYGRLTSTKDANQHITSTGFNPIDRMLPTSVTTTNANLWTSTVVVDRGRQLTETAIDVNGRQTDVQYDGLGRTRNVWNPDHPKASNPTTPNIAYDYGLYGIGLSSGTAAPNSWVQTRTLREDGTYAESDAILDSFGEEIETQATPADASPGLVSTQVEYNSLGKPWRTAAAHWDKDHNPSGTFLPYGDALPSQQVTTYDGLSRPLTVTQYTNGAQITGAVTTTAYPGVDRTDVTNPSGNGTTSTGATSTFTDARGRTSQLWTYHNNPPTPTGNLGDADVTKYDFAYQANGSVTTVTDATGANKWITTSNDLLGRSVTKQDPDTGTSTSLTDDAGLLIQTQDGRGQILSFYYDALNRKTAEYNAPHTAVGLPADSAKLATWAYDSVPANSDDHKGFKGLPASSTRYTGNGANAYTSSVTGYDPAGRVLGASMSIPNADGNGALATTYQTTNYYTPTVGLLDHTDLPAVPKSGMPLETVYNSYNANGLLLATGGNADYVVATTYDQLGRIASRTLGDYPFQVVQQNLYDPGTGRLTNTFIDAAAGQNGTSNALNTYSVDYSTFTYNPAGQITSVADLQNYNALGSYQPIFMRDVQCYTYDYAGRLTNAWTDTGDQTPSAATGVDANNPAIPNNGPRPGSVGSCASSTTNNPPTPASAAAGQISGSTAPGAKTSPAPYWQTYTYDNTNTAGLGNGALTGNRSTIVDHDVTGTTANDVTATSTYPAAGTTNTAGADPANGPGTTGAGPHLSSQITRSGAVNDVKTYRYDGAGNTTRRPGGDHGQTLTWNPEGRLDTVSYTTGTTTTTASYVYDADGNQLIRRDTQGTSTTTTLFLGTTEIHLTTTSSNDPGTVTAQRYYAYDGAPTIVCDQTGTLTYEVANPQGTSNTTINAANGQIKARRYTKPFGDTRGTPVPPSTWPDDHTFLGKTTDASTGLVDVGARKYDANLGRFTSADPVLQTGNPQQIGGYAYAGNDPINASDPTGLDPHTCAAGSHHDSSTGEMRCVPDPDPLDQPVNPSKPKTLKWALPNMRSHGYSGSAQYTWRDAFEWIMTSEDDPDKKDGGWGRYYAMQSLCDMMYVGEGGKAASCMGEGGGGPGLWDMVKMVSGYDDVVGCLGHGRVSGCLWLPVDVAMYASIGGTALKAGRAGVDAARLVGSDWEVAKAAAHDQEVIAAYTKDGSRPLPMVSPDGTQSFGKWANSIWGSGLTSEVNRGGRLGAMDFYETGNRLTAERYRAMGVTYQMASDWRDAYMAVARDSLNKNETALWRQFIMEDAMKKLGG
ncbi:RHS repeat-associated core domain-containing protein [Catenulispora subtropica]|uniref:RHS repeat-associated core domain-containing protein n=1 Tax=Catenulispora subtropica TaxID=450798 RepID=A0ABN2SAF9_9ACTN